MNRARRSRRRATLSSPTGLEDQAIEFAVGGRPVVAGASVSEDAAKESSP